MDSTSSRLQENQNSLSSDRNPNGRSSRDAGANPPNGYAPLPPTFAESPEDEIHHSSPGSHSATPYESERDVSKGDAKILLRDLHWNMTTLAIELGRDRDSPSPTSPASPTPQIPQTNGRTKPDSIYAVKDAMLQGRLDPDGPHDCPKLPISHHQPIGTVASFKKSISRRHARIQYNEDYGCYQILILGRNGGFVDDSYYKAGKIVALKGKTLVQLGPAAFYFFPGSNTGDGETDSELLEEADSASQSSLVESVSGSFDTDDESIDEEVDPPTSTLVAADHKVRAKDTSPSIKRKGPGRPPKNGVMSKRQEAELAKQGMAKQESETKSRVKGQTGGRGRGQTAKAKALEQSTIQPSGKRKYKKRKKQSIDEGQTQGGDMDLSDAAAQDNQPNKTAKERRTKPPRSPSPEFDESTLTPEQLAKPQHSYVVLIHEALSNAPNGHMALPQIYRAIVRKYPYFKVKCSTQGWQSSVRHNLGQHPAFIKVEKEGKGFSWGIDSTISIEKERKRRATPPPQPQPKYYPAPESHQPRPGNFTNSPSYANGQLPPNTTYPNTGYPVSNKYPGQPGMQPTAVPPRQPYGNPGFPLILNPHSDTYRSPYDLEASNQAAQANGERNHENVNNLQSAPSQALPHAYLLDRQQATSFLPRHGDSQYGVITMSPDLLRQLSNLAMGPSARLKGFRSKFLDHVPNKVYAANLIDDALSRTLDPTMPPRVTEPLELATVNAIIDQLTNILANASKNSDPTRDADIQSAQHESRQAVELAEQVTKSLLTTSKPADRGGSSQALNMDGPQSLNGPKHKRALTTDDAEQPGGKKLSVMEDKSDA